MSAVGAEFRLLRAPGCHVMAVDVWRAGRIALLHLEDSEETGDMLSGGESDAVG